MDEARATAQLSTYSNAMLPTLAMPNPQGYGEEHAAGMYSPTGAGVTITMHNPFENTTVSTFAIPR